MSAPENGFAAQKRRRSTKTKRWTPDEDRMICEQLRETVIAGGTIEQPTARIYYDKMAAELSLEDVNHIKLKAKVSNLKGMYMKMVTWRSQTGQGVLETSGEQSVKDYILSKCPLFDILDEIFASRANVNPPVIVETGTGTQENEEVIDSELDQDVQPENNENQNVPIGNAECLSGWKTPKNSVKSIKRRYTDGMSALAEIQEQRKEIMDKKYKAERIWRREQLKLEQQKLEIEKAKLEQSKELKQLELEQSERIEKFRIEQEMKCKIEMAKLQFNSH